MYYVYIMASAGGVLYTGVTGNMDERAYQHKAGIGSAFTKRYRCHTLVYAEPHASVVEAIAREKQIKGWSRTKKKMLIQSINPAWMDLMPTE